MEIEMQTDIEVLKSKVEDIKIVMASVSSRIDLVLSMQTQIVELRERGENHRQAIDRAFDSIRSAKDVAEKANTKIDRIIFFVKGGSLVGVLLFSFVQWYVLQQLGNTKMMSESIILNDRRLMRIEDKMWPESGGRK